MKNRTHKRWQYRNKIGTTCGVGKKSSFRWKDVNCKNCLKKI